MPIFYAMGKLSKDSSFFLNFIRLLACQMVVLGHLLIYCYPPATGNAVLIGQMIATSGVILFFIISGLLISRSLLSKMDDGDYGFRSYLVDRFSRIYSGLVPCLVIITLADLTLSYLNPDQYLILSQNLNAPDLGHLGWNLMMLQQFDASFVTQMVGALGWSVPALDIPAYGFDLPLWTLAIEWWLYMLFGWVVIGWYARKRKNPFVFVLVLAALLIIIAGFMEQSIVLIALWFVGVAITFLMSYSELRAWTRNDRWSLPILLFILMTSIVGCVVRMVFAVTSANVLVDPILALFLSMILFSTLLILDNYRPGSESRATTELPRRTFAFGAAYSYTLYLVHFPLLLLLDGALTFLDKPLAMLKIFVAANLVSIPVAMFTEMRHRQLASWLKKKLNVHVSKPDPAP